MWIYSLQLCSKQCHASKTILRLSNRDCDMVSNALIYANHPGTIIEDSDVIVTVIVTFIGQTLLQQRRVHNTVWVCQHPGGNIFCFDATTSWYVVNISISLRHVFEKCLGDLLYFSDIHGGSERVDFIYAFSEDYRVHPTACVCLRGDKRIRVVHRVF